MANSKSAKKRININQRNRLQNKYYKTSVRTLTKLFFEHLELCQLSKDPNKKKKVYEIFSSVSSIMDKGTKKNIFHKNTTARKKAKLAAYLREA